MLTAIRSWMINSDILALDQTLVKVCRALQFRILSKDRALFIYIKDATGGPRMKRIKPLKSSLFSMSHIKDTWRSQGGRRSTSWILNKDTAKRNTIESFKRIPRKIVNEWVSKTKFPIYIMMSYAITFDFQSKSKWKSTQIGEVAINHNFFLDFNWHVRTKPNCLIYTLLSAGIWRHNFFKRIGNTLPIKNKPEMTKFWARYVFFVISSPPFCCCRSVVGRM